MGLKLGVFNKFLRCIVCIKCVEVIVERYRVSFQYLDGLALVVDIPRTESPKPIGIRLAALFGRSFH